MKSFNENTKRLIIRHLTPENRYSIWKERFAEVLKSEWNPEQRRFLEEVSQTFSVELFTFESASHKKFKKQTSKDWTERGTKLFSWEQLRMINSLEVPNSNNKVASTTTHPTITKIFEKISKENRHNAQNNQKRVYGGYCDCTLGGWCGHTCYNNYCSSTTIGCGWILLESCQKLC
jgi:hypothetical protein